MPTETATPTVLMDRLAELNPEAVLFEPRETYDRAVVSLTRRPKDHWPRTVNNWVAVYDYDLLVECTMEVIGVEDEAEAMESSQEWVDFNMVGLWAGEGTPVVKSFSPDDDEEDEDDDADEGHESWLDTRPEDDPLDDETYN